MSEAVTDAKSAEVPLQNERQKSKTDANDGYSSTKTGIIHQIILTIVLSAMMSSVGLSLSYAAILLPQVTNKTDPFYMDDHSGSWYASLTSLTSILGSTLAGIWLDKYGRRSTFFIPLIPMILMWILSAIAPNKMSLFISRALIGAFSGFIPVTCQIYLAECTDPYFRSFTINVGYVALAVGILISYTMGSFMTWRTIAWANALIPLIVLIAMRKMPESPVWLVRNKQIETAKRNLLWLRGNRILAAKELYNISVSFEEEILLQKTKTGEKEESFLEQFKIKSVYRPSIIVLLFILFFNISGTYVIVFYAVDIIASLQLPMINKSAATVIMAIIRLAVTILFCWLFIHVPRRKIYLAAGIGSAVSTITLAIYIIAMPENVSPVIDITVKSFLMSAYVATNTGFQIAPGFLIGELLPAKLRGRIGGYVYTMFSVFVFILAKIFPFVRNAIGISGIFIQFGLASIATAALVYYAVPETKGKSLSEIEDYFRHGSWNYRHRKKQLSKDFEINEEEKNIN